MEFFKFNIYRLDTDVHYIAVPKHKPRSLLRGERQTVSRRWLLTIFLVAAVIVASKAYTAITHRQSPLDSAVLSVTTPVVFVVKRIGDGITYTVEVLAHFPTLLREKKQLRAENDWLSTKVEELKYLESENEQLRAILGIPLVNDFKNVEANVIARPYDIVLDSVLVGIGINQQVKAGNLVVNEFGVVGTISEVFGSYSRVRLSVSEQSYLWATTKSGGTEGLLVGGGGTILNMMLVPVGANIALGDKVYTMGRQAVEEGVDPRTQSELLVNQPRGVYIGTVVTHEANRDGFLKIQIEPAASPNKIGAVVVMVK